MIKCIIFDVGGVLNNGNIDIVHKELNKKFGKAIFDRKDSLHRKALLGKLTEKQFFNILSKKHGIPARKLQILSDKKYEKIAKTNNATLSIAKKLKQQGYKICILSNVTPQHKTPKRVQKTYAHFHHKVLSCDVGCIKPQAKIFKIALSVLKAKPEECVYIEDREEFLQTPKKLGINTIHFKGAQQLKIDLKKLGVKL